MEITMKLAAILLAMTVAFSASAASAESLSVDLRPSSGNPASPQMGDNLSFHTVIRNDGSAPVDGLIGWISLVQIDKGKEQPVDLEDWSAHKAVTAASLAPGQALETDWPMRLVQAGRYRVVVSAVSRDSAGLVASPFADFTVRQKPVVESQRVLPVAFGLPVLIGAGMLWRRRRQ
jgi:hypothetical protein